MRKVFYINPLTHFDFYDIIRSTKKIEGREINEMKKNVYSLILSEDVVAAIDKLAYMKGMSRSGLINEILASTVSYKTPEMLIRETLEETERALSGTDFVKVSSGANALAMKTAITYKYNPSLKLTLELQRLRDGETVGKLRISMRSRSEALIMLLIDFMKLWQEIEKNFSPSVEYYYDNGRITRDLHPSVRSSSPLEIGASIGNYAKHLSAAADAYFASGCERSHATSERIAAICSDYYLSGDLTV